jgi:hypothetical protein
VVAALKYASVSLLLLAAFNADRRWFYHRASVDDLTGKTISPVVTVRDTERLAGAQSSFGLSKTDGLHVFISLAGADRFPMPLRGEQNVSMTYRADGGEIQKETTWTLSSNNRTAVREVSPDEARTLFSGDFIIVSVDQTEKRYRYEFGNREGLMEAVEDIINAAPPTSP